MAVLIATSIKDALAPLSLYPVRPNSQQLTTGMTLQQYHDNVAGPSARQIQLNFKLLETRFNALGKSITIGPGTSATPVTPVTPPSSSDLTALVYALDDSAWAFFNG